MRSPAAAFDLRAALSDEIRAALDELDASSVKAKAIHRCRVRLKRARALARVGRACAPGLSAVFNESARTIMQALSQARDLTALAESARRIAKRSSKKENAALNIAATALDAARVTLPPLDLDQVHADLRDLLSMALVWPESSPRQIERGAERVARRARAARRDGRGSPLAARRHEWRKREKDRLYAAILLNGSWPEDRKRRCKQGEALGDVLGRERDALLLIERIEADAALAGGDKPARRALRALRRRSRHLGRQADALGAKLHAGGA